MNVGPTLVAHGQSLELREPGEHALDDPAGSAKALLPLDADARDPVRDAARGAGPAGARVVVTFVRLDLIGRRRGRPLRIGPTESSIVAIKHESWTLAGLADG